MRRNFKILILIVAVIGFVSVAAFGWLYWQKTSHTELPSLNEYESVLTTSNKSVFEPVLPNTSVELPKDFRFHDEFQHEWWHFFANVEDQRGKKYGIEWSYFRVANDESHQSGWHNPQIYISYISIASAETGIHEQRVARGGIGQAGMDVRPFRVWIDNWRWRSLGRTPFPGQFNAQSDDFSLDLNINATGPYVLPGEKGYVKKDAFLPIASYNVASPFLNVNGKLKLNNGRELDVSGQGWLSKEWGSGLLSDKQQGWDWFVLHLDDNSTLSIHRYRQKDQSPFIIGYVATNDGKYIPLNDQQIILEPLLHHILENGRTVPLEWELRVPKYGVNVRISPLNAHQWLPFVVPYWQGAIQTIGSHNSNGFMQLVGY
ncbi:Predicted secreted hydrolase [Vibrio xiamenensis]|uniref:Predicted secreted hydrolase n=1 Tax=Vibrio xiamenensis TaxID=861298 RepID=A0A1G7WKD3_9VIBR|nr:lipocalin-like domain-containing protein [Vibrio xiamenensis]SDG72386.1 Predicted secreted hydrolase [Vibrio xiamenensis]